MAVLALAWLSALEHSTSADMRHEGMRQTSHLYGEQAPSFDIDEVRLLLERVKNAEKK